MQVNTKKIISSEKADNGISPFKARAMPDFSDPGIQSVVPACSLKTLTKSQPFNLSTDNRGAEKKVKFDIEAQ